MAGQKDPCSTIRGRYQQEDGSFAGFEYQIQRRCHCVISTRSTDATSFRITAGIGRTLHETNTSVYLPLLHEEFPREPYLMGFPPGHSVTSATIYNAPLYCCIGVSFHVRCAQFLGILRLQQKLWVGCYSVSLNNVITWIPQKYIFTIFSRNESRLLIQTIKAGVPNLAQ